MSTSTSSFDGNEGGVDAGDDGGVVRVGACVGATRQLVFVVDHPLLTVVCNQLLIFSVNGYQESGFVICVNGFVARVS